MNKLPRLGAIFDRHSIRYPLARLIVAATLFGIGLAFLANAVLMLNNQRRDIQRTLTAAASAAGTAASAAVVFHDKRAARAALKMFEAYPEIEAAAIYPNEGYRLAGYGDERLLPPNAEALGASASSIVPLANAATLHLPIVVDDSPVGTVYLHARLDAYWHSYLATIATTVFVSLSAGVLALLLAMRFLDRLILPIRLLAEAANDARLRQDFSPRAIPAADDEIGGLVRNFNALLAEVDTGRKSLQTYQDGLELLVAERTTELSAAKDAAEEANNTKSRFLAAASHDLRQPIQGMYLFMDALKKTPMNDEQRRIADYLSQATRSLAEILNALLDVSKLDGGMVKPHLEAASATVLFRNMEIEFAPLALAKGLRFKLFFPSRELMLFTDAKLLQGLLRNLIDNAIKYTESGGVLVGIRRRGGCALIQVWDTGIGIAPEHLGAVFDEYFQVGNPQRDQTKGLGLGLAIAKRVAGILGSRLDCRSRLARGSRFELRVPLADEQECAAGDGREHPAPGIGVPARFADSRVVVVEDDAISTKAIGLALGAYGMDVATFHSAEDALADARIAAADFYIVDFRLPGMSGVRLLDTIRERAGQPIRAVLMTGETSGTAIGSLASLRWKVLLKPVDTAALMAEIAAQTSPAGASCASTHAGGSLR